MTTREHLPAWFLGTPEGEQFAARERAALLARGAEAAKELQRLEAEAGKRLSALREAKAQAEREVQRTWKDWKEAEVVAGRAAAALISYSAGVHAERSRLESVVREAEQQVGAL